MNGHNRSKIVMLGLVGFLLAAAMPAESTTDGYPVGRCSGSTEFGEPEKALCYMAHPACPPNPCVWPDTHIRVWVDEGFEGSFTPMVHGSVRNSDHVVCQGTDSCEGTYQWTSTYGQSAECGGWGPYDGSAVLVRFPAANTAWAVHIECWLDGY